MRSAFAVFAALLTAGAQEPPRFEVASIKPSQGGRGAQPIPGGLRYAASGVTLKRLVMDAYRVKFEQVIGGPAWVAADHFDVNAKAERPSTAEELRIMLQNLLAERFHLQFHRTMKEGPVYVLGVDAGGPKLTATAGGDTVMQPRQEQPFHIHWTAHAVSMDYLAWRLPLDRPVLNRTALEGSYDFELAYTAAVPPELAGEAVNGRPIDTLGPTVFEALRRQLGLRLDARKGPVEVLVIDHAEKPKAP